jgi:hypothetical protein
MKFPKAHAGVKKLFLVEILMIAVLFVALVGTILVAIGKDATVLSGGALVLAAGIAGVVAFILSLVGLHQAGKDEVQIQYAFCMAILSIILGMVASILGGLKEPSKAVKIITDVLETGESLTKLFTGFYVLLGISSLAKKLGDSEMERKGKRLANWVILLYCVSIVLGLVGMILGGLPSAPAAVAVVAGVVAIVASVAELVVYILTVVYYGKAVKMLEK